MKLFEVLTQYLYHSTSDKDAIQALREGVLHPSYDAIDDEENVATFISTTTNPNLRFYAGWPDTGNIQFVFDPNTLVQNGYQLKKINRFNEVRIILPEGQEYLPINQQIVDHVTIENTSRRYFKSWAQDVDVDTRWGHERYQELEKNELSPKGEFVGSQNPFGIIKMLSAKRRISVVDKRKSKY